MMENGQRRIQIRVHSRAGAAASRRDLARLDERKTEEASAAARVQQLLLAPPLFNDLVTQNISIVHCLHRHEGRLLFDQQNGACGPLPGFC